MFNINKDTVLDVELLQKMIKRFNSNVQPQLQKYKNYYDGKHKILTKKYNDNKEHSRAITNFTKNIADSYVGYIASPSYISYKSEQDIEEIMEILRYNDYQAEDTEFLLNALVYGTAAELMYNDNQGHTRFKLINPLNCFGVYDDSLTNDLLYFVRLYKVSDWDNTDKYKVDVYSDYDIKHYTMFGITGNLTFIGEEPHYFAQVPANIFNLPDEKSVYDCVIDLQDAYNEVVNAEINDYSAFCDAYLLLLGGIDADKEDIAEMKENRVLMLPEGANAQWLTKTANDTQVENILKRIQESIYRIAACPDFSSESFVGGVSSGIAIRYRLTGMETRAAKIAAEMKKALQRRIEIICGIASLKYGEEVYRDIQIDFKRNIPEDITSTINMINSLKGTVSDSTLLSQLPFISDVNMELEAVQQQKAANMELYGFGLTSTSGTDEEDEE